MELFFSPSPLLKKQQKKETKISAFLKRKPTKTRLGSFNRKAGEKVLPEFSSVHI